MVLGNEIIPIINAQKNPKVIVKEYERYNNN